MKFNQMNRRTFIGTTLVGAAASVLPLPAIANTGPVKIGMISPLTGSGGSYGPNIVKAAQVVATQINDAGGILGGRMIEIIAEDSETNSTASVRAARKLLDVNQVSAIVGMWGSGPTLAVKPLAIEKGVSLSCLGAADAITEGDTQGLIWRFQATGREWGVPAAKAMLAAGHKKIGILAVQTAFTQSMIAPFIETIEAGGGQVVVQAEVKPDQPTFRAEVDKVMGQDVTAVFLPAYIAQFTSIAKEWYRGGYKTELYTLTIAASAGVNGGGKFISAVGNEVGEGIHHLQPTNDSSSAVYKEFESLMGAKAGTFLPFSALCADSLAVQVGAMERAGTADATVYTKEILTITNGPGTATSGAVNLLNAIRAGQDVNYTGYGMDVSFYSNGNLKDRPFGHFVIQNGIDIELGLV
ncbi:ABC transporter substrate-binding protein [uncultured Planktomarina sp.]|uniref:ABC transporter substrate-binding protein n=1 Tax=uncultured Planktomarina sp. TaxID=1538529 RepID=UPI0032613ED2